MIVCVALIPVVVSHVVAVAVVVVVVTAVTVVIIVVAVVVMVVISIHCKEKQTYSSWIKNQRNPLIPSVKSPRNPATIPATDPATVILQ